MTTNNAVNASTTGIQVLQGTGNYAGRTLTAGQGISITNGDGTAGNPTISTNSTISGTATNIGATYSGSTFTITAQDGSSLSSTNFINLTVRNPSLTQQSINLKVTADISFKDSSSGSSNIIGNTFGTTSGLAWGLDIPFWVYAVVNTAGNAVTFMLSRVPALILSPAAGKIAKSGSAVASTQGSFFAIDSSITVANYASTPCFQIGWIQMTKNSSDDWLVTNIENFTIKDYPQAFFGGVTGHNGATAGFFYSSNGGDTLPVWSTNGNSYWVNGNTCYVAYAMDNFVSGGVGTGILKLVLPLASAYSGNYASPVGTMIYRDGGGSFYTNVPYFVILTSGSNTFMAFVVSGLATGYVTPATFATTKNSMGIQFTYPISTV